MSRARLLANEAWAERVVASIESAGWAAAVARRLTRLAKTLARPGPVKDVLSGSMLGHPAHPMLTDVTIGAWTSAFFLDLIPSEPAREAADHLIAIGMVSAVPTAMTGLSDLGDTTGRARPLGGGHALANLTATALYATAWIVRRRGRRGAGVALSLAGATAATLGGFLGAHLAYRRGVGVDTTVFEAEIADWTRAAADHELPEGTPVHARVAGNDVMLVRAGGRIHALADRCTHRGGPLHHGRLDEDSITCPWHSSRFRLADGALLGGPAVAPQRVYDVRVRDGEIEIRRRGD